MFYSYSQALDIPTNSDHTNLIAKDLLMVLKDGDDQLDSLHRNLDLLVQRHRHNTVLKLTIT